METKYPLAYSNTINYSYIDLLHLPSLATIIIALRRLVKNRVVRSELPNMPLCCLISWIERVYSINIIQNEDIFYITIRICYLDWFRCLVLLFLFRTLLILFQNISIFVVRGDHNRKHLKRSSGALPYGRGLLDQNKNI